MSASPNTTGQPAETNRTASQQKKARDGQPTQFEKLLGTEFVEMENTSRTRAAYWKVFLYSLIGCYLIFDMYNIVFMPKVIVSGTEGSDQWGSMPNLLVCHDSQYQVQWRAADMFVRHFASTTSGNSFNVTEHVDFEVSVRNVTAEPPGQGGSCLKFSTSLTPFSTSTPVSVDHEDPIAWYVFDFHVSDPNVSRHKVGVPDTLYLIAEDRESGHQSLIGTTPHLRPETDETVASTMIEIVKTKRIRDGDFGWAGLPHARTDYDYHGIQHTVRVSHVNHPAYSVACSPNFSTYCSTEQANATMAVVQLVVSNHDVQTLHKMGRWRRALMACGAAGGFLSIVTLIYNKIVVKKFAPSFHDVLTTNVITCSGLVKPSKTHQEKMKTYEDIMKDEKLTGGYPHSFLMDRLIEEGEQHDDSMQHEVFNLRTKMLAMEKELEQIKAKGGLSS